MSEFSKIMELRGKLSSEEDIKLLDNALDVLGNAFKSLLIMTRKIMQGETPDKLDLSAAGDAVNDLRSLGAGRGYSIPEFRNEKELCDFIVRFGSEIIRS